MSHLKKSYVKRTHIRNILSVYHGADKTTGTWYWQARTICERLANDAGVAVETVVGVMAALSPGATWDRNVIETRALITGENISFTTYPKMVVKARKILAADVADIEGLLAPRPNKSGFKILRFYRHICQPWRPDIAVIDRHAVAICLGRMADKAEQKLTRWMYTNYELAYQVAAKRAGVAVSEMQAITWCAWR